MGALSEQKRVVQGRNSKTLRHVARARYQATQPAAPTIRELGEDRNPRILVVLRAARWLLVLDGWAQPPAGWLGEALPGWTLDAAISSAGHSGIESEWTRHLIRKIIGHHNIPAWNDHVFRTKTEVLGVLDRAIEQMGGRAPRRGGWTVGVRT